MFRFLSVIVILCLSFGGQLARAEGDRYWMPKMNAGMFRLCIEGARDAARCFSQLREDCHEALADETEDPLVLDHVCALREIAVWDRVSEELLQELRASLPPAHLEKLEKQLEMWQNSQEGAVSLCGFPYDQIDREDAAVALWVDAERLKCQLSLRQDRALALRMALTWWRFGLYTTPADPD